MTLLAPARSGAAVTESHDDRPVLCIVDAAHAVAPVLHRAVLAATDLAAPLEIVLLHPRPGFTTDAAVAARQGRQLTAHRDSVGRVLESLLAGRPLPFAVQLQPYARRPWGDAAAQAQRAAQRCIRRMPARAVVTAAHPSLVEVVG